MFVVIFCWRVMSCSLTAVSVRASKALSQSLAQLGVSSPTHTTAFVLAVSCGSGD